jgi:hypothetical protein
MPQARDGRPPPEWAVAARAVVAAANAQEPALTPRQHRVLLSVLHHTALWSRSEARVYLAQLAAVAFGVERAEGWHLKRTKEALRALAERGLVSVRPPTGRPPGGAGPAYLVALPLPGMDPSTGATSEGESDPSTGASSNGKVTPTWGRNGPQHGVESDPAPGPPLVVVGEEEDRSADDDGLSRLLIGLCTGEPERVERDARTVLRTLRDRGEPEPFIRHCIEHMAEYAPRLPSYLYRVLDTERLGWQEREAEREAERIAAQRAAHARAEHEQRRAAQRAEEEKDERQRVTAEEALARLSTEELAALEARARAELTPMLRDSATALRAVMRSYVVQAS